MILREFLRVRWRLTYALKTCHETINDNGVVSFLAQFEGFSSPPNKAVFTLSRKQLNPTVDVYIWPTLKSFAWEFSLYLVRGNYTAISFGVSDFSKLSPETGCHISVDLVCFFS